MIILFNIEKLSLNAVGTFQWQYRESEIRKMKLGFLPAGPYS